jgi:isopenicillin-N epimerase
VDRRGFLIRTGLTFAAGALAMGPDAAGQPQTRKVRAAQADDWEAVRGLFNLTPEYLHFGGLLLASHPAPVRDAIEAHRRGLDDNPVDYLHGNGPRLEAGVLRAAAAYIGGDPTDIALTDSTTMGLGLLYTGFLLGPEHEVLTTRHDFYATHEALRQAADRTGASLRQIALYQSLDAVSQDEIVQTIAQNITPRTRLLAVTWVHSSTGLKLPIQRIADMLAEVNAQRAPHERVLFSVDGVHGFGVEATRVADLGCDFFVAGCHKWMFGPRGTGIVWGRGEAAWSNVRQTIPTFGDGRTYGSLNTPGGFHSFEHRWALSEAFNLHLQLGPNRVAARIHELNARVKAGLASIPGVRLVTPMDESLSAGLVCFEVAGLRTQQVVDRLHARNIIATSTPYSPSYPRLAPGLLTNEDQVDAVLGAVRAIA